MRGIMRCLSVLLSRSCILSKRVNISSKFIHHRVACSRTIIVFPYQTLSQYFDGHPLTKASNASGISKCRDCRPTSGFITFSTTTVRPPSVIHTNTAAPDYGKLVTLIAGKRRRLLFAGDGRRSVYDKKPRRYAEDNRTEFNAQW